MLTSLTSTQRLAELQRRKDLAELNERRKQERVAQAEAQEVAAQEVRQSRGTRLRTQTKKPDYVTDGLTERQWAKAFQKMDRGEDVELPDEFPGGSSSRRGKRKRYEDDSEDFEMASDEDEEDAGRPQRSSRNRKAKAPAQVRLPLLGAKNVADVPVLSRNGAANDAALASRRNPSRSRKSRQRKKSSGQAWLGGGRGSRRNLSRGRRQKKRPEATSASGRRASWSTSKATIDVSLDANLRDTTKLTPRPACR